MNVTELKVALYDTIESQAILNAKINQIETTKGEKMKSLDALRLAEPQDEEAVVAAKVELFDLIESQSVLVAENNKREQQKGELLKQLDEARQAEKEAAEEVVEAAPARKVVAATAKARVI